MQIKLYFISCCLEDDNEDAKYLAETLDNQNIKLYFLFLSYVLKIINVMNTEFQSKHIRIHILFNVLEANTKLLLSNFMNLSEGFKISKLNVSNRSDLKSLDEIYLGIQAKKYIETNSIDNLDSVRKHILDFYEELIQQILKRFDFDNEVIKNLRIIDPKFLTCQNSVNELLFLVKRFPNLIEIGNKEIVVSEYKLLSFSSSLTSHLNKNNLEEFWMEIYNTKNACEEPIFENIASFIMKLMTFPQSSAAAERKFSELQLIKTKKSNRFDMDTVEAIMFAKELCPESFTAKVWTPM